MLFHKKPNPQPEQSGVRIIGQEGNQLEIHPSARLSDVEIVFQCQRGRVTVGPGCSLSGVCIFLLGDGSAVELGEGVEVNASARQPAVMNAVGGCRIQLGDGCLLSNQVELHTSDYHGIYDAAGERLNRDADIILGKRVWMGMRTLVLKGSRLADGCVVGAGAVVSGAFDEPGTVVAGVPARVIRRDIIWDHARKDHL